MGIAEHIACMLYNTALKHIVTTLSARKKSWLKKARLLFKLSGVSKQTLAHADESYCFCLATFLPLAIKSAVQLLNRQYKHAPTLFTAWH